MWLVSRYKIIDLWALEIFMKAKNEGQDTKRVYDKLYINGSSSDNKVLPGNPIKFFKLIYSLGPRCR